MTHYKHLFSPLQVGTLTLRNRIGLAPMSFTKQAPDGGFSDECIAFTEAIAKGGTGLITLGEANIGLHTGKTHDDIIMLGDPKIVRSLYKMSEAVHRHGAAISMELSHGGAMAPPIMNNNQNSLSPCTTVDGTIRRMDTGAPLSLSTLKQMTVDDMNIIADDYADGVLLLKKAGFDMVQIHMGHGWLLHQFLSPLFNKRDDEFGGTTENRARFPLMVLDRIRDRVGTGFPLDIRISGTDIVEGGLTVEEVTRIIALMQDRLAMASITCGGIFNQTTIGRMSPSVFLDRGCNVYLAEHIKNSGLVSVPVSTVGGLCDPEELDKIIYGGRADFVNMGRGLIADHAWAKKAKSGQKPLRCLRCNVCQEGLFQKPERMVRCSVNPKVGLEARAAELEAPSKNPKKVLVIGGGPAGMSAAKTAAERGHRVVLCEKSGRLGGALHFSDYVPFKYDIRIFKDDLINQILSCPDIEVRLNTAVDEALVSDVKPDAVIVSIGAKHIVPPIPGIDKDHVIFGSDIYGREEELTGNIVMLGGGLVGVETAIYLADMGKQVTVVEMAGKYAVESTQGHLTGLNNHIESMDNLKIHVNTRCMEITDKQVICQSDGKALSFDADHVIVALGMQAKTAEAFSFDYGNVNEIAYTGDCKKAGKIKDAVTGGFWAAYDL